MCHWGANRNPLAGYRMAPFQVSVKRLEINEHVKSTFENAIGLLRSDAMNNRTGSAKAPNE